MVTRDGAEIFLTTSGRGRRVYVLNGGPANDHRYLADDLARFGDECGYEFVLHDYRGSGQSPPAPAATYTFAQLADDLDALRRELGDETIVVLGHSLGGFVGTTYALRHPERCAALVLVGTFP